jgi:hypothetical protein
VDHAVGFARPDTWRQAPWVDAERPWHAVEAIRPPAELDGEVELAVCGAIVQVWGRQDWAHHATTRTACTECVRLTAPPAATGDGAVEAADGAVDGAVVRPVPPRPAEPPATGRPHLRVVS